MNATFGKRLERRDVRSRLGQPRKLPQRSQLSSDLRDRISSSSARHFDARNMINKRRNQNIRNKITNPNFMAGVTVTKPFNVPFLIPQRTITNEYFSRNQARLTTNKMARADRPRNTNRRQQIRTSQTAGPLLKTIRNSNVSNERGAPGLSKSTTRSYISPLQGFRLDVINLMPSVTLEDVYELFSGVGKIRSVNITRIGQAEVIFSTLEDAQSAISRYNGRELDGAPMHITLATCVEDDMATVLPPIVKYQNSSSSILSPLQVAAHAGNSSRSKTNRLMEVDIGVVNRALHRTYEPSLKNNHKGPRPVDFNVNLR